MISSKPTPPTGGGGNTHQLKSHGTTMKRPLEARLPSTPDNPHSAVYMAARRGMERAVWQLHRAGPRLAPDGPRLARRRFRRRRWRSSWIGAQNRVGPLRGADGQARRRARGQPGRRCGAGRSAPDPRAARPMGGRRALRLRGRGGREAPHDRSLRDGRSQRRRRAQP